MPARLGNALLIASAVIALGWIWLNSHFQQENMVPVLIVSAGIVGGGLLARYVLSGRR